jgi:hypothetical protein
MDKRRAEMLELATSHEEKAMKKFAKIIVAFAHHPCDAIPMVLAISPPSAAKHRTIYGK